VPKSKGRRQPPRRPAQRHTSPRRPAPPPVPEVTAPGLRGAVERRSAPLLTWLAVQPKALVPVGSIALLAGGFLAPTWLAVPLLAVLIALVGWLTYLSWPAIDRGARVVRVATLLLLVIAVVITIADGS